MLVQWYALRSKPHREELLWEQLNLRGIENYYPRIRVRPVNPRSRKIIPYFPGYLFVRLDPVQVSESIIQWIPGTAGLVAFGGEPACVPDHLIRALRTRIEGLPTADSTILETPGPGDPVLILEGPLKGYEAIFDQRISGTDRVRVLMQMFHSRCVPVNLRIGQVAGRQHSA
jgi:transcription antitermination factor NusG